jgi:hypothetical protein
MSYVWILFSHWVADFVCQSDWMAQNKSKNFSALVAHIAVYSGVLAIMTMNGPFAALNGLIHLVIDFFTSRIAGKLWADKKVHYFFVVIGFDQFLHTAILLLTYSAVRQ